MSEDVAGPAVGVPVETRSPFERERWFADRLAAGEDPGVVDAAREALGAADKQVVVRIGAWAFLIVDSFRSTYAAELKELPAAVATRLLMEATIAYLYGFGVMVPAPSSGPGWHPLEWADAVPEHLRPDVAGAVAAHRRVLARLPGGRHG